MKNWETESNKLIPTIIGTAGLIYTEGELRKKDYHFNGMGRTYSFFIKEYITYKLTDIRKMYYKSDYKYTPIMIGWL